MYDGTALGCRTVGNALVQSRLVERLKAIKFYYAQLFV